MPALTFPAGIYKASAFPNFAAENAHVVSNGVVRLRYTGSGDAVFIDSGATGNGVNAMTFGPFLIEATSAARSGLHIQSVHHSLIDVNIRGAGQYGVWMNWCVCTEFIVKVSQNEGGGWYAGAKPAYGILADRRGSGGDYSAYCLFRNPIIEGPTNGIYVLYGEGNVILAGTAEGCATGLYFDTPSLDNKVIGADFEANSVIDIEIDGTRNAVIDCDTFSKVNVGGSMSLMRGGAHSSLYVLSTSNLASLDNLRLNRFNTGVISDAGSRTIFHKCINCGTAVVIDQG